MKEITVDATPGRVGNGALRITIPKAIKGPLALEAGEVMKMTLKGDVITLRRKVQNAKN